MRYLRVWFRWLICIALTLMALGAASLWVRSYWAADVLAVHRREGKWPSGHDSCGLLIATGTGQLDAWYFHYAEQLTPRGVWHVGWSNRGKDGFSGILDSISAGSGRRFIFRSLRSHLGRHIEIDAGAPLWALLLGCSVAAGVMLYFPVLRWMRRRHSRSPAYMRCAACGYDLRATPTRCPECGAIPRDFTG